MKQFTVKMMIPVLAMSFAFQGSLAHATDETDTSAAVEIADLKTQRDVKKDELRFVTVQMKALEDIADGSLMGLYRKYAIELQTGLLGTSMAGAALAARDVVKNNPRGLKIAVASVLLEVIAGTAMIITSEQLPQYRKYRENFEKMSTEEQNSQYRLLAEAGVRITVKIDQLNAEIAKATARK
jgi:hypothetical protein